MSVHHALSRVLLALLASLAASCAVGLEVARTTAEETVREPVPTSTPASFRADLADDHLRIRILKADQVRVSKYEVETRKRYRMPKASGFDIFMDALNPVSYVIDVCIVLSAPFRADYDVAWGPIGGLAAVIVPGVCTHSGSRNIKDHLFDTSTSKTLLGSDLQAAPRGVVADLRFVTDREVFSVRTNYDGEVVIPLSRLTGTPGPVRTRVTVGYDGDFYAIAIDGSTVTCTRTGASTSK